MHKCDLTKTELRLLEAVEKGEMIDYSIENESFVPEEHWGENRIIRAQFIVELFLAQNSDWQVHPKGVRIKGARITGCLDFEDLILKFPLILKNCWFDEEIILTGAEAVLLNLSGSRVPRLLGERLSLKGSLYINDGFVCEGLIDLRDSYIGKSVNAESALLKNGSNAVFNGSRMVVQGGVYFSKKFNSTGQISLIDAKIGGTVSFNTATLENPSGLTLDAARAVIKGGLFLNGQFKSNGEISLVLSQISGALVCEGAILTNPGKKVLNATGISVASAVLFTKGFIAKGTIVFSFAKIGGTFEFREATLENPGQSILDAQELTTTSTVLFIKNFIGIGSIKLVGSNIGGALICSESRFTHREGVAFNATRVIIKHDLIFENNSLVEGSLKIVGCEVGGSVDFFRTKLEDKENGVALDARLVSIKGSVKLNDEFGCLGKINFSGAKVGSDFLADRSVFKNAGHLAFEAGNLNVRNNLSLNNIKTVGVIFLQNAEIGMDFRFIDALCEGTTVLTGVRVGGELNCTGTVFKKEITKDLNALGAISEVDNFALIARGIEVKSTFHWREMQTAPEGMVVLLNGKVGQLFDDSKSWPSKGQLIIENFTYSSFHNSDINVKERIEWLQKQKDYSPQPYEQVVKVLRLIGHDKNARKVARAKQNDLRKHGQLGIAEKCWNWFLDFTIGHGYQVYRILIIAAITIILGTVIFSLANHSRIMLPIKGKEPHPGFNPFIYSLDVFLPIVDLQQQTYWVPVHGGSFYMTYFWVHIFSGWLITTLAVVGLTGIVKKD